MAARIAHPSIETAVRFEAQGAATYLLARCVFEDLRRTFHSFRLPLRGVAISHVVRQAGLDMPAQMHPSLKSGGLRLALPVRNIHFGDV
jgi:hypothetical protein